jgi:hypothetical protein
MPASEYGSYYWCVILNNSGEHESGERVHLHADGVAIDEAGCLTFTSAGRRPAGVEPKQEKGGDEQKQKSEGEKTMIYMAFAPGSWKMMYAAKLRDGSPASVEHWAAANGRPEAEVVAPAAGAAGFTDR